MLRIITGKAGSGKTYLCLEEVTRLAKEGRQCIMIVPEQTGYTYEREIVEKLPGILADRVSTKSFRRLCRDILSESGGSSAVHLEEAEKIALVRRAVAACLPGMKYYRKKGRDTAFYRMLAGLFDELRNAGATPGKLREAAEACGSELSAGKFGEIAMLLEKYEELLSRNYFDDAGELSYAASLLSDSDYFENRSVYIDAFSGFTAAEYEFIRAMLPKADSVNVALTCDEDDSAALAVSIKTKKQLQAISREVLCTEAVLEHLEGDYRHVSDGLVCVEEYLRTGKAGHASSDGVSYFSAGDRYDEAEKTAAEIMRLVREENYRFSEIAVLFRNAEDYREPVRRTFREFGIPSLFDEGENMLYSPVTVFMLAAFELAGSFRTDSILRLLKCGLCDISEEETSLLEIYAFVHGIDGRNWEKPFDANPDGAGEADASQAAVLEKTENARKKIMSWLLPYVLKNRNASGRTLIREAFALLETCGGLKLVTEKNGEGRNNGQIAFSMLDKLYAIVGEDPVSRDELSDTLRVLASGVMSSDIPAYADTVFAGDAAHSRPYNPRACFVLGLNDGVFPRDSFESNILTMEERDVLFERDMVLTCSFEQACDMEGYFLYSALCAPSEKLYLSCCGEDGGSGSLLISAELQGLIDALSIPEMIPDEADGIVNAATAEQRFAESVASEDGRRKQSLLDSEAGGDCAGLYERMNCVRGNIRNRELSKKLAGDEISLSASKIDVFEKCPFRYFVNYTLGIRRLKKVDMTADLTGSMVHKALEDLLKSLNGDLTGVDDAELEQRCSDCCDDYLAGSMKGTEQTGRMTSLIRQIKDGVTALAKQIRLEQMHSRFRPVDYELDIGRGKTIETPVYELSDGSRAVIQGSIDRVDIYERDGKVYLRVVDYKTGFKEFNLYEVFEGLNIQMLLYLFALNRNNNGRYDGDTAPAGVLYMPGDPAPGSDEKSALKSYCMKGILIDDEDVLNAMEDDGQGVFIPAKIGKNGAWETKNLVSEEDFARIERRVNAIVENAAESIRNGNVKPAPAHEQRDRNEPHGCQYCDYRSVCMFDRISESQYREIEKKDKKELLGEEDEK